MLTFALNILVLLVLTTAAHARDAVVVQSLNVKPYEDLYQSFRTAFGGSVTRVILSERGSDLARVMREERPKVIVAVGTEALRQARGYAGIPVVYAMVLNPASIANGSRHISGIGMSVPPERQMALFRKVLPESARKIGVLFDPVQSGAFVKAAAAAARAAGLELVATEVASARDVPRTLASLRGHVDALWLIPDPDVVVPDTVEHLLLFGVEQNVPVFAFSAKYLKLGALLAIELDPADIGRQAAEMARSAVAGEAGDRHLPPRAAVPQLNHEVAKKLGLRVDREALGRSVR